MQRELKYLPRLTALELPKTTLSGQELEAIRSAYPDLHITYTVELLGQEYSPDVDTLDLSDLKPIRWKMLLVSCPCCLSCKQ